jgi:hypothetical protein
MEHVAADDHQLRRELDDLVQRARERQRDVGLTLIDPAWSQPLILAVAQVEVGEVNEAQAKRDGDGLTNCAGGS